MASAAKFLLGLVLVLALARRCAGHIRLRLPRDCVERCSNGKNLESCAKMCAEACLSAAVNR
ncbi:unnamed protein product [Spirodela intermedia]|uniref:Uncharacterized protein n=1 Tax=Spirodela intermedia TaxID=51605 RepID=A0A7I8IYD5_SPIIN|nr:unnamed protein product [Spirodela intermedia]CAA6662878.1 unnamed protein product [Spirodela intermedia]